MEIVRLTSKDYDEGMAFLSLSFNNLDFHKVLPKIYDCDDEKMSYNRAIKQDNKIMAIVGLFPMEVNICGKLFKVGGIGGVSAHPDSRKGGYMTTLMSATVNEMKEQGYHFSVLGGLRQRYSYFGYEKCGLKYEYTVLKYNIAHTFKNSEDNKVNFIKITKDDVDYIEFAKHLYSSAEVHLVRTPQEFYNFLISWGNVPYIALDASGKMLGYFCSNQDSTYVTEINAISPECFSKIVSSWVEYGTDKECVTYTIPPWECDYHREINKFANSFSIKEDYNYNIFDWQSVVEALLMLKQTKQGLCDGRLVIGIEGYGNLEIVVRDCYSKCSKTNCDAEIILDQNTAKQFLFGPVPPTLIYNTPNSLRSIASSWFPLPLAWLTQDEI